MVPAVVPPDARRSSDAPYRHRRRNSRPRVLPERADASGLRPPRVEPRLDGRLTMCGIVGHFAIGDRRADERLWRSLVNIVAHRGPDDSTFWSDGRFAFGHRRLSIIELSRAGRQPMATDDGELVVTF